MIEIDQLSKRYVLGAATSRYDRLSEAVSHLLEPHRWRVSRPRPTNVLWALRDVSFKVPEGQILGVIGHNGAGKSTLLKVLARITEPTSGRVALRGRVSSLLEVGTGFHPDLTGRENIFLSGSILGMTRYEIRARFDEIVEFAEIESFLDTPVKRYSSGMYVRLAFAVAAHLEPEILIVDEVLSVGDAAFVRKCLGKMGGLVGGGRTVLFVSHNMGAVQRLCSRVIQLERGSVVGDGSPEEVVQDYVQRSGSTLLRVSKGLDPLRVASFTDVFLADGTGRPLAAVRASDSLRLVMEFVISSPRRDLQLSAGLTDPTGDLLFGTGPIDSGLALVTRPGTYRAVVDFPRAILLPRAYGVTAALWSVSDGSIDTVNDLSFVAEASQDGVAEDDRPGRLSIVGAWRLESLAGQASVEALKQ